ncbi:MAG: FtsX-like permease family protein [Luteitalea sp.]|nr:FtsX-like permease family protein [Luteitalea sp.]
MKLRLLVNRLVALLRTRRLERELDDEVMAHLELAERDAIAAGMSPDEARRRARRLFGGIDQMKEEHRDRRSARWIEMLLGDLRYGLASLARSPAFAAVTIGVLALGIGANAAMFSVVDAVLLKPLPYPEPDRIVRVWEAPRPGVTNATSTLDFLDWQRLGTSFEALAAEAPISAALTGAGEPVRLSGKVVSAEYFEVFATRASLGRTFGPDEDQPGAAPVVVLSHAAWQTYFGGDPGILNRRPILNGEPHQVVGVLPPGAFDRDDAEFWKPLVFRPEQHIRDGHWLTVFGRLRRDATLQQARQEMHAIDEALTEVTPDYKREWTIVVERLDRLLVGNRLRQSIVVAFGAVALVLLIACANVANLLLTRGAARKKELAVRAALGASRGRLVAQLLAESAVLCLLGGAAGVTVALLLIRIATPILSEAIPYTADVSLDIRVLAFAAVVALGVALLVGAFPSWQTSFGELARSLNLSTRGSSGAHSKLRRTIVVGEVALSLVLVCGALLLFRSLLNLQRLETGVRTESVITMSVDLPVHAYATPESAALFYEAVTERLESVPGVAQAALSTHLPLQWINHGMGMQIPGPDELFNVRFKRVDPGYFDMLAIPLRAGRGITDRDRDGAPLVVVINEALAAQLADLGGMQDPVGQAVRLSVPHYESGSEMTDVQVVGVIRSERVDAPGAPDPRVVYVPLAQVPSTGVKLMVRTQAEPASVMPGIREAVREIDPNLPLGDIATMQQVRERTLSGASRPAWVIGAFAAVAVLLAALGLYGVLSHAVTERRREIGIRMALGARGRDVLSHVLQNALSMVILGLAAGLVGALVLTRVLESLLFEVSALDPLVLAVACVSMTLIGLLAGFVPASRAAHVDPIAVLRDEG